MTGLGDAPSGGQGCSRARPSAGRRLKPGCRPRWSVVSESAKVEDAPATADDDSAVDGALVGGPHVVARPGHDHAASMSWADTASDARNVRLGAHLRKEGLRPPSDGPIKESRRTEAKRPLLLAPYPRPTCRSALRAGQVSHRSGESLASQRRFETSSAHHQGVEADEAATVLGAVAERRDDGAPDERGDVGRGAEDLRERSLRA